MRFRWEEAQGRHPRERGEWVQLLPLPKSEGDGELAIDPRAAFCEEGVREVRVGPDLLRVIRPRRESWQLLLERLPPAGSILQLSVNISNLMRQKEAVERLMNGPLPHHRGLLRLLEDPDRARWPDIRLAATASWFLLTDPPPGARAWDGTAEQRRLVAKALGTPDIAFLEGPPGSGKTHAICELILQLIAQGLRVLLCSTTHVAVDNVLERLVGRHPQVEALRIGHVERVDERVQHCQLDARIEALTEAWRRSGAFPDESERALEARDAAVGWTFQERLPARRVWVDVDGRELQGKNPDEIQAMRQWLEQWKRTVSGPRRAQRPGEKERPWEIALLAFYNKQELAMRDMLREVTGQSTRQTRFELPHTELICATVDRFQGREADWVLLSLRNTGRVGHLDSPNRLNVGVTRARHLLQIFGKRSFFLDCGTVELERLASETHRSEKRAPVQ